MEDRHERAAGAGYPRALQAVGEMAEVLRAADLFTAKISPRALLSPLRPEQAARELARELAGGPVVGALSKAAGVCAPRRWVQRLSGKAAVVVQRAAVGHAPVLVALRSANGQPMPDAPRRDTAQPALAVTGPGIDRAGLPRVLPEQVYGLIVP